MSVRTTLFSAAFLAAAASAAAASAHEGPAIEIRDAVAQVEVIPENRTDIAVQVDQGHSFLPGVRIERHGDKWLVDGGVDGRRLGCYAYGLHMSQGDTRIRVAGRELRLRDAPHITLHVPLNARLAAGGAVFGEVRDLQSLDLALQGCGDWRLNSVKGPLSLAMAGSGDVHGADAGAVKASIAGSGDLNLEAANGGAEISVAGSGDVRIHHLDGPLRATVRGSGDIRIAEGRAPSVEVNVAGSGDVTFGGEAGSVQAAVAGSGDVRIHRATGPVSKAVSGSGEISVGH
jgi:hypothetical protein